MELESLRKRIRVARKQVPADTVLKGCRLINVFSGDIQPADVAIADGYVAGVGEGYPGHQQFDLEGRWIAPGLIDAHMHIESSMMLPSRLAPALLARGTTAVISDPHEISNVMGIEGIRLMIRDSGSVPLDFYFMAPSCVPATALETSGARLRAADLASIREEPRVLGLAEVMNYPGVLDGEEEVLQKLLLFEDEVIDGHAPGLRGESLQGYVTAGIRSDHETSDPREGLEKLQSGMVVMIREGSTAKSLEQLLPLVTEANSRRFCLVSDDVHPSDLFRRGHLDHILRRIIALGLDPVTAVQMATLNPAEHFGLRNCGAVAPGFRADIVVIEDLEDFRVGKVFKDGHLVAEGGTALWNPSTAAPQGFEPTKLKAAEDLSPKDFRIRIQGRKVRVIEIIPNQILTDVSVESVKEQDGWAVPDIERDILKLAVVERHRGTGRIGLGMVRGFGLDSGAISSSISHDSHNIIALGTNDQDIYRAVREVKEMGGGIAVVRDQRILAKLELEVGGLMSRQPLPSLVAQLDRVKREATSLGCKLEDPVMVLSFLALPVIPKLKLTDLGLVDVEKFRFVPLFIENA